jgi:hypothetical protein
MSSGVIGFLSSDKLLLVLDIGGGLITVEDFEAICNGEIITDDPALPTEGTSFGSFSNRRFSFFWSF